MLYFGTSREEWVVLPLGKWFGYCEERSYWNKQCTHYLYLPHSIVVYCASINTRILQVFSPTVGCTVIRCYQQIHSCTGWFYCWEERGCCWNCRLVLQFLECFPIQDLVYSLPLRTKHWNCYGILDIVLSCSGLSPHFLTLWGPSTEDCFSLSWYFPIRDSVYSLPLRTKYQIYHTVIQHVQWTSLCCGARTQFAVASTRIDPTCSPGSECHLLRFLLTAVLSQEMSVSARVTLDTEFFCRCYAVQPRDFSLCRIRVTLDTVYDCWCYAFICWNACEVAGLAAGSTSGNTAELPLR